jgi:predicted metal-dependent hydrolase
MSQSCGFWPFGSRSRDGRRSARPVVIGERQIDLQGQSVSYVLKRSSRARRVRIEIRQDTGLVVVVPRSYRLGDVDNLLKAKQGWILRHLARARRAAAPPGNCGIRDGDLIPYLGRNLRVIDRRGDGCPRRVTLTPDGLLISGASGGQGLESLAEQWYRSQARSVLRQRVDAMTSRLGLGYGRIIIRGQRTRWGSCSQRGTLSFNWRLMMTPEAVIDYVIIHEVAHLREMNHTERFWKLVAEECPRWREHRRWLDEHGAWLTAGPVRAG